MEKRCQKPAGSVCYSWASASQFWFKFGLLFIFQLLLSLKTCMWHV